MKPGKQIVSYQNNTNQKQLSGWGLRLCNAERSTMANRKRPLISMGCVCPKFFQFKSISIRNVSKHQFFS